VSISPAHHVEVARAPAGQEPASSVEETPGPAGEIELSETRRRYFLQRFWRDARGFWGWRSGGSAWALSGLTFPIILANLGPLYAINLWNRALFDGLEKHDARRLLFLSLIYFPIMVASVFVNVMQVYGRMTLQRRGHAWLDNHLVGRWLSAGVYYYLNLVTGDHQNREFRIADDVRVATESPVHFLTGCSRPHYLRLCS
jgi:vitamin B12/bleomycin/antimicrobial peptide transport system ATP-binding/permease protein